MDHRVIDGSPGYYRSAPRTTYVARVRRHPIAQDGHVRELNLCQESGRGAHGLLLLDCRKRRHFARGLYFCRREILQKSIHPQGRFMVE